MSLPLCVDCEKHVDLKDPSTLAEVIGFAKARTQGGQNHVRFREETGRWLCGSCAVKRKHGIAIEQGSLL